MRVQTWVGTTPTDDDGPGAVPGRSGPAARQTARRPPRSAVQAVVGKLRPAPALRCAAGFGVSIVCSRNAAANGAFRLVGTGR